MERKENRDDLCQNQLEHGNIQGISDGTHKVGLPKEKFKIGKPHPRGRKSRGGSEFLKRNHNAVERDIAVDKNNDHSRQQDEMKLPFLGLQEFFPGKFFPCRSVFV